VIIGVHNHKGGIGKTTITRTRRAPRRSARHPKPLGHARPPGRPDALVQRRAAARPEQADQAREHHRALLADGAAACERDQRVSPRGHRHPSRGRHPKHRHSRTSGSVPLDNRTAIESLASIAPIDDRQGAVLRRLLRGGRGRHHTPSAACRRPRGYIPERRVPPRDHAITAPQRFAHRRTTGRSGTCPTARGRPPTTRWFGLCDAILARAGVTRGASVKWGKARHFKPAALHRAPTRRRAPARRRSA
jgi:hypothetical protein